MTSTTQPLTPDHVYCGGCTKAIRKEANYCPYCGDYRDDAHIQKSKKLSEKQWEIVKGIIIFYAVIMASIIPLFWLKTKQIPAGLIFISVLDVIIILLYAAITRFPLSPLLQVNRKTLNHVIIGVLGFVPLIFLNMLYHSVIIKFLNLKTDVTQDPLIAAGFGFFWIVVINSVMPAVWEEIAFRGLIQGKLGEVVGHKEAILLTSILFAIVHINFFSWIYLFFLGIVLGFLRHYTKSLWACIILHFMHNFVVSFMEFYH